MKKKLAQESFGKKSRFTRCTYIYREGKEVHVNINGFLFTSIRETVSSKQLLDRAVDLTSR